MQRYRKRVREIGMQHSSLSGIINSTKLKKTIQFESSLESDFIVLLEFDTEVKGYLEQPISIPYLGLDKKPRRYTPDFYVQYSDPSRPEELIEIKYSNTLKRNHFKLAPKFAAAEKFCKKNKLSFRKVTELDIRPGDSFYLENLIFLSRYRDVFHILEKNGHGKHTDISDSYKIIDHLKDNGPAPIEELLYKVSKNELQKGELLFMIWYLISHNFIGCDLHSNLTMQSKVWVY